MTDQNDKKMEEIESRTATIHNAGVCKCCDNWSRIADLERQIKEVKECHICGREHCEAHGQE